MKDTSINYSKCETRSAANCAACSDRDCPLRIGDHPDDEDVADNIPGLEDDPLPADTKKPVFLCMCCDMYHRKDEPCAGTIFPGNDVCPKCRYQVPKHTIHNGECNFCRTKPVTGLHCGACHKRTVCDGVKGAVRGGWGPCLDPSYYAEAYTCIGCGKTEYANSPGNVGHMCESCYNGK